MIESLQLITIYDLIRLWLTYMGMCDISMEKTCVFLTWVHFGWAGRRVLISNLIKCMFFPGVPYFSVVWLYFLICGNTFSVLLKRSTNWGGLYVFIVITKEIEAYRLFTSCVLRENGGYVACRWKGILYACDYFS